MLNHPHILPLKGYTFERDHLSFISEWLYHHKSAGEDQSNLKDNGNEMIVFVSFLLVLLQFE